VDQVTRSEVWLFVFLVACLLVGLACCGLERANRVIDEAQRAVSRDDRP
jgi:hypothetical protein